MLIGAIYLAGLRLVISYLIIFMTFGILLILAGTSFRSMIQKEVEDRMMGRVFGFVSSVGNISIPLAMLVFGLLLEYVPHATILAVNGVILLPISIFAYGKYMASQQNQHQPGSLGVPKAPRN